jgi:hypothetical protein
MPYYQTFFPAWLNFYYTGLWIKIKGYKPIFQRNGLVNSVLICIAAITFSIIEGYGLIALDISVGFASSQIKISSFLYTFAIINLLMVA